MRGLVAPHGIRDEVSLQPDPTGQNDQRLDSWLATFGSHEESRSIELCVSVSPRIQQPLTLWPCNCLRTNAPSAALCLIVPQDGKDMKLWLHGSWDGDLHPELDSAHSQVDGGSSAANIVSPGPV